MILKPSTTDKSGGTYASRVASNAKSEIYKDRNVILVRVRKISDNTNSTFDDHICELVLQKLKINIDTDTIGAQYLYDKGDDLVELWLQPHKSAQALTSDTIKELNSDFLIVSVQKKYP